MGMVKGSSFAYGRRRHFWHTKPMISMDELQTFANLVADAFGPDKVILFGSYAEGTATSDSDVDLLVVLPFEGSNLDK